MLWAGELSCGAGESECDGGAVFYVEVWEGEGEGGVVT